MPVFPSGNIKSRTLFLILRDELSLPNLLRHWTVLYYQVCWLQRAITCDSHGVTSVPSIKIHNHIILLFFNDSEGTVAFYSALNHLCKPVMRPHTLESLTVLVRIADFWSPIQISESESLGLETRNLYLKTHVHDLKCGSYVHYLRINALGPITVWKL